MNHIDADPLKKVRRKRAAVVKGESETKPPTLEEIRADITKKNVDLARAERGLTNATRNAVDQERIAHLNNLVKRLRKELTALEQQERQLSGALGRV